MFWLKLKGGALQLTLFIVVVIALLLTSFILLIHTNKQFQIQSNFIIETTKLSNNGIDYALNNSIPLNDTLNIDIQDENYKSLKIYQDFWGVFEKATSISQIKNKRFQKVGIIGAKQPNEDRTALYIQDNKKPLTLVGNTEIVGVAYIPKQGVRAGNIAGQSYYGKNLIYGKQKFSGQLPRINEQILNNLNLNQDTYLKINQDHFFTIESTKQLSNSFLNPAKIIFSETNIDLKSIELRGQIIVQSKTKINVYETSKLKDVILIAPEIEIKDGVNGIFQAIASKQIVVGKFVTLNYPSALILNEEKTNKSLELNNNQPEEDNSIIINPNSTIKGLVVYLGQEKQNNYTPQIVINSKVNIYGELYCNQNIELLGSVYGSVFTSNFIANQSGTIYQNHIYNGVINSNELPQEYIGLLFSDNKEKGVLKWLY